MSVVGTDPSSFVGNPRTRSGSRRRTNVSPHAGLMVLALVLTPSSLHAEGLVPVFGGFYGGAGAAYTDFDDEDNDARFGWRAYGGFDFARVPAILRLGAEAGVMQTGSFEIEDNGSDRFLSGDLGIQATLTAIPRIDLHARGGFEFGDNDGPFAAGGIGVNLFLNTSLRAEYQLRDGYQAGILSFQIRIP